MIVDDSFQVQQDQQTMPTPVVLDVLVNDSGGSGNLMIASVGSIPHGTVSIQPADPSGSGAANHETLLFTPEVGYFGTESFSYVVSDSDGDQATATVTLTIFPRTIRRR